MPSFYDLFHANQRAEKAETELNDLKSRVAAFAGQLQAWGYDAAAKEMFNEILGEGVNAPDYYNLKAERDAMKAELESIKFAARMPDDYEYGLPSWINQRLYAAYIGAQFSPEVLGEIKKGTLTFPESPAEIEVRRLKRMLDWALKPEVQVKLQEAFDRQDETQKINHA